MLPLNGTKTHLEFALVGPADVYTMNGVYAHGDAENLCDEHQLENDFVAPDLIGTKGAIPELETGTFPCRLHGVAATLFFWRSRGVDRGYVVLDTDKKSIEYATQQAAKAPTMI